MSMSFKPLLHLLVEREMVKLDLVREIGLSSSTVAKLWKGENVELAVVEKLCDFFQVPVEKVVEFVPRKE